MRSAISVAKPTVIVCLCVVAAFIVGWTLWRPAAPPAVPDDLAARRLALVDRGQMLMASMKHIDEAPWFVRSPVADALARARQEVAERQSVLAALAAADLEASETRARHRQLLDSVEAVIAGRERTFAAFHAAAVADAETVRSAFVHMSATADALALLEQNGIRCPDERVRLTQVVGKHDEGLKLWLEAMRTLLTGGEFDETVYRIGIGTIGKSRDEIMPTFVRVKAAREDVARLGNHRSGIEARLAWVKRLLSALPADDPLKQTPQGTIESWNVTWSALLPRFETAISGCMDRTRDHERSVAALEDEAAAFLDRMLRTLMPKALEIGFDPNAH